VIEGAEVARADRAFGPQWHVPAVLEKVVEHPRHEAAGALSNPVIGHELEGREQPEEHRGVLVAARRVIFRAPAAASDAAPSSDGGRACPACWLGDAALPQVARLPRARWRAQWGQRRFPLRIARSSCVPFSSLRR
jgi:hypothetical protein